MKKIFRTAIIAFASVAMLASCAKDALETVPTQSMSGAGLFANANAAMVPLNGIYRSMYTAGWSTGGNTHQCFGISAYNMMADVMGEDYIMQAAGSGWFWYDAIYGVKQRYTSASWRSYDLWNAYYTWIANANYIIAAEETMEGATTDVNYVIGQAYAIRAYSYFMLAQSFARTYKGHESDPGVPIYTEPTSANTEGQPRSSVQQVYDLIVADITKAVSLLQGTTQKEMSHISYAVALGIQARIAMVMEDWNTAKTAAHAAIEASGKKILPVSDFAGLNDVSKGNVMWGASIISDQVGMYASFFAHADNQNGPYAKGRALKQLNNDLYDLMNATDQRKAWWQPNSYQDSNGNVFGHTGTKFSFTDVSTWMGDYIWMRVEEMYLTAAEAECMLGDEASAKADLGALMAVRDPSWAASPAAGKTGTAMGKTSNESTGSLREEIINQRRLELWGEFGRIYDLRRLNQGFRRTRAQGWPDAAILPSRPTDNPDSYMWVLTIPQGEFDGNTNLNQETDQNPTGDTK